MPDFPSILVQYCRQISFADSSRIHQLFLRSVILEEYIKIMLQSNFLYLHSKNLSVLLTAFHSFAGPSNDSNSEFESFSGLWSARLRRRAIFGTRNYT